MQNPPKPEDPQTQSRTALSVGKTSVLNLDFKLAGLLCYLPICAANLIFSVLWLITEPKDVKFLRFHAIQSLLLCGGYIALAIVVWPISMLLKAIPFLGFLYYLVQIPWVLITMAFIVINIVGMIKAYRGEMYRFPYVAELADKFQQTI